MCEEGARIIRVCRSKLCGYSGKAYGVLIDAFLMGYDALNSLYLREP